MTTSTTLYSRMYTCAMKQHCDAEDVKMSRTQNHVSTLFICLRRKNLVLETDVHTRVTMRTATKTAIPQEDWTMTRRHFASSYDAADMSDVPSWTSMAGERGAFAARGRADSTSTRLRKAFSTAELFFSRIPLSRRSRTARVLAPARARGPSAP